MTEMYEAWMSGQAPPSSIRDYLNTNMSSLDQASISDKYSSASNVAGTSTIRPLNTPMINNPLFMPTAPTNSVPQPIMKPKSNNDPPSKTLTLTLISIVPLFKLKKLLRTRNMKK
ncbi:hypothetical protein KY284_017430 [Solanum tuberosum]|nr:hypothetical protein KY284_017430 [Solanum tuberosum]